MCEVATALLVTSLVVGAATSYTAYQGQEQAAKAQARYNAQAAAEGEKLARESLEIQSRQMALRAQQEEEAKAQAIAQTNREFMRAKATAKVAAGEAGVAGLSIDQLLADFDNLEALELGAIERNDQFEDQQLETEKLGIRANMNQRLSSLRTAPVPRPSQTAAVLGFTGSALNSYSRYGNARAR